MLLPCSALCAVSVPGVLRQRKGEVPGAQAGVSTAVCIGQGAQVWGRLCSLPVALEGRVFLWLSEQGCHIRISSYVPSGQDDTL